MNGTLKCYILVLEFLQLDRQILFMCFIHLYHHNTTALLAYLPFFFFCNNIFLHVLVILFNDTYAKVHYTGFRITCLPADSWITEIKRKFSFK